MRRLQNSIAGQAKREIIQTLLAVFGEPCMSILFGKLKWYIYRCRVSISGCRGECLVYIDKLYKLYLRI